MGAQENVAYLLDQIPQATNDLMLLCLLYWMKFDKIKISTELAQKLRMATNPESIARHRRTCLFGGNSNNKT